MTLKMFVMAAAAMVSMTPGAPAAALMGQSVSYQLHYDSGSTHLTWNQYTATAGAWLEFNSDQIGGFSSIDISDSQITVLRSIGAAAAPFNGDILTFPNYTLTNVSINTPLGNPGGPAFTADRLTFDAHNVYINWQGGSWNTYGPGNQSAANALPLILDVTGNATAAPEPSTLALFVLAAIGFGVKRKR